MTQNKDWVIRARAEHHDALKAMMPADSTASGLQVWRRLRRIENEASAAAVAYCNGETFVRYSGKTRMEYDFQKDGAAAWERLSERVHDQVKSVFGYLPKGFFVNGDPRGYALKLEPESVPYKLHRDMGGYQILAPTIE